MKTSPLFAPIEDLVLHRSPMLLLQSVAHWEETGVDAIVNPQDSHLFADAKGMIPAWVGIEYMAQAISAFAGINAKTRGEPLCLGFLLGTRKYAAQVASFNPQHSLVVKVRELLRDEDNLVLFDCRIYAEDKLLASAEIKAIQPKNVDAVINHFKQVDDAKEGLQ